MLLHVRVNLQGAVGNVHDIFSIANLCREHIEQFSEPLDISLDVRVHSRIRARDFSTNVGAYIFSQILLGTDWKLVIASATQAVTAAAT